jgi:hypothetical protein
MRTGSAFADVGEATSPRNLTAYLVVRDAAGNYAAASA